MQRFTFLLSLFLILSLIGGGSYIIFEAVNEFPACLSGLVFILTGAILAAYMIADRKRTF